MLCSAEPRVTQSAVPDRMDHALVIGGSVAGLCAARVLSDFFEQVTVLERDAYPKDAADRPGVPHGRLFHWLLKRGLIELEVLFPGFQELMQSRGASPLEMGVNFVVLTPNGWIPPRAEFRRTGLQASRALIDSSIRELCAKLPNVTIRQRVLVTGLSVRTARETRCDGAFTSDGTRIHADLVVDATGVSSKAPEWLTAIGVQPPHETIVDAFVGYAGIWMRMRDGVKWPKDWWWTGGAMIAPVPPADTQTIILSKHEHDRWLLSISGQSHNYPPQDFDGLRAIAMSARSPVVSRMLELMEPVSPVRGYRPAGNRWRHYERWRTPLTNFIAVGDAFCSYNPTNGLGLSAASVTAQVLRDQVRHLGPAAPSLANAFHREQAHIQRGLWQIAVGNDFRFPGTHGRRTRRISLINLYRDRALRATGDPIVQKRVQSVLDMTMPLSELWTPSIVWRVLRSESNLLRRKRNIGEPDTSEMPPPMPALSS
jgi:2-polyprenyl-6-methoxyphenol hydroxylase-like FAD-dependent oxidoreductase